MSWWNLLLLMPFSTWNISEFLCCDQRSWIFAYICVSQLAFVLLAPNFCHEKFLFPSRVVYSPTLNIWCYFLKLREPWGHERLLKMIVEVSLLFYTRFKSHNLNFFCFFKTVKTITSKAMFSSPRLNTWCHSVKFESVYASHGSEHS